MIFLKSSRAFSLVVRNVCTVCVMACVCFGASFGAHSPSVFSQTTNDKLAEIFAETINTAFPRDNSDPRFLQDTRLLAQSIIAPPTAKEDSVSRWKIDGTATLNFNQVGLSNWAGGGQNTIGISGLFNGSAIYTAPRFVWENALTLGYGITKIGSDPWRKNDDRIIFVSKASLRAADNLKYSGLLDFRTQFAIARNLNRPEQPVISGFMAPGFLTMGLGADWKPSKEFSLVLSPLGGRGVFVWNDELSAAGAFGVGAGHRSRLDIGALLDISYTDEVMENINLRTRLNLFSRYTEPDKIVVTWETLATMKVNSFINVNIGFDLFYDDRTAINRENGTVGPATQFRNILAIGIGYRFDLSPHVVPTSSK